MMTKKLTSLVLALVMCMSLCVSAFAKEAPMVAGETRVVDNVTISFVDGQVKLPRANISLVNHVPFSGSGPFTFSFQCRGGYGSKLLLTIDLLNGYDVLGEVSVDGNHFADFLAYGGQIGGIELSRNDGSDWTSYVTVTMRPVGGASNGYFSANQYN